MALITTSEAKEYIPTLAGTADDSLLSSLIARFDQLAAAFCCYIPQQSGALSLESGTYLEILDGPGGKYLYLSAKPATAIASIYDDPDLEYGSDDLIAASDYVLHDLEGLVILKNDASDGTFSENARAIKVTYTAGYTGGTMPGAIKHAACLQVAHWYGARAHIGRTNVSAQGQTAALSTLELLPETREALKPYRLATGGWIG